MAGRAQTGISIGTIRRSFDRPQSRAAITANTSTCCVAEDVIMSMERTVPTYGYDDARATIGEHRVSNSEVQTGDDDQPHLPPVIMTPTNPKRGGFRGKLPDTKLAAKARQDASLVFAQRVGPTILEMRVRGCPFERSLTV